MRCDRMHVVRVFRIRVFEQFEVSVHTCICMLRIKIINGGNRYQIHKTISIIYVSLAPKSKCTTLQHRGEW